MSEVDRGTARYLTEARNGGYETWNERTKFANNPAGWADVREQFGWGSIDRMSNDDKVNTTACKRLLSLVCVFTPMDARMCSRSSSPATPWVSAPASMGSG